MEWVGDIERANRGTEMVIRMYMRYEPDEDSIVTEFLKGRELAELSDLQMLQLLELLVKDRIHAYDND